MAWNKGRFEFLSVDLTFVFEEVSKMGSSKNSRGTVPIDKLELASSTFYKEIFTTH